MNSFLSADIAYHELMISHARQRIILDQAVIRKHPDWIRRIKKKGGR